MNNTQELANILSTHMGKPVLMASDSRFSTGYWSTGFLPIDVCLGGGWVKGKMSLLTGESATLKSLVGYGGIAKVQAAGGTAALFDTEHAYNPEWGAMLGIDNEKLILIQPETGEEAMDQMEVLIRNDIDMIVFDSIASMVPRSEREIMLSGKDNVQPARIAWVMSIGLRKLNSANTKTQVTWITQKRANIGAMAFSPKTLDTGGKAIGFYASQILELKKTGKLYLERKFFDGEKDATDKQIIAQKFRVELMKSRNRQPFELQHFVYDLVDHEIDNTTYLINQGLEDGTITKKGAWWTYSPVDADGVVIGEHKAGSKDKFRDLIATTPEAYNTLLSTTCKKYKLEEANYGRLPEDSEA